MLNSKDFDAIKTLSDLLRLCEHEFSIMNMYRDGSFEAWIDDKANDQRICIRYRTGTKYWEIQELTGFDAEKNTWKTFARKGIHYFDTLKGTKAVMATYRSFAMEYAKHYPALIALYRDVNRNMTATWC